MILGFGPVPSDLVNLHYSHALLRPLLACTVEPQLGASSVGNLTEPVISTVSVTSNQTHPEPVHSV